MFYPLRDCLFGFEAKPVKSFGLRLCDQVFCLGSRLTRDKISQVLG